MLTHPQIDPVAIAVGPIQAHWYGLMYLLGFAAFWILGKSRARRDDYAMRPELVSDFLVYGALGVILGGRIGYMLFYGFSSLIQDPLSLFRVWEGGMSFHGGLIGVGIAMWLYARKLKTSFWNIADWVSPMVPLGLMFGRIGNFINAELWGRPTDVPWGMVFPQVDALARHPSQLYEAALEGLVLFVIVWVYSSKPRPPAAVTGLFIAGYGFFRFIVEFFREPDSHLGFVFAGWMSRGQELSLPMIIIGIGLMVWGYRRAGSSK
ncbi:MAG: prolipoprotein diacylglyceryl transferase [Thiotrichales bacterium]